MASKFFQSLYKKVMGNEWDRLLDRAEHRHAHRFLLFWNRGLGDIALGLHQVIAEIRARIPDADIAVVTRRDLAEAFQLLPVDHVLIDEQLARGEKQAAQLTVKRMHLTADSYDVVLDQIDPTAWFRDRKQRPQPHLKWPVHLDALSIRFDPYFRGIDDDHLLIGAHVASETGIFYGYKKDWRPESWRELFARIGSRHTVRFVLFGHQSDARFDAPNVIDLRGKTSFLELMALIKNRCRILIAPDSGVLTMTYYLDAAFPLGVVSLWADPRKGILKQAVASRNPQLQHVPIVGAKDTVDNIGVDEVAAAVESLIESMRRPSVASIEAPQPPLQSALQPASQFTSATSERPAGRRL